MAKKKWYMPPQKQKQPLHVTEEVKAELQKLADEMVASKESINIQNYITLSLVALRKGEGFGATRLNRFLAELTRVSEEVGKLSDKDADAWYKEERAKLTAVGCAAYADEEEGTNNGDR